MTTQKMSDMVFISFLSILTLSTLCLVFIFSSIYAELINYVFLSTIFISFLVVFLSIRKLLIDTKSDISEKTLKEKNIRDIYQYNQILDPPDIDN
jgi:hypothetical protein